VYTPNQPARCRQYRDDAYARVIPDLHPGVVIAVNYGYDDPSIAPFPVLNANGRGMVRGNTQFDSLMAKTTADSAQALSANGRDLVIVEPMPLARDDPTECLAHSRFLEECRYVARARPSKLELLYRKLDAQRSRVWSANFDRLVCPFFPICDPVVAGHIVKVDSQHLTRDFAEYIAPEVATYLESIHLIPRST
jgi:hypothetical protein